MKLAGDFLIAVAKEKKTANNFATTPERNRHNWTLVKNTSRPPTVTEPETETEPESKPKSEQGTQLELESELESAEQSKRDRKRLKIAKSAQEHKLAGRQSMQRGIRA